MSSTPSSLGLLSGYNSSGSDEDDTVENTACTAHPKLNPFADAASSSEDEAENDREKERAAETLKPLPCPLPSFRLPAPRLGTQSAMSSGSVFANPFQDQQQAQRTILERHVKLSDGNWAKAGKGVCLAYERDGRCRYGTKCKYSHGSDLPQGTAVSTQREIQEREPGDDAWEVPAESWKGGHVMPGGEEQGEEMKTEKGKRKKPGLGNTLIPPKKSLKNYEKQLSAERPWAL
ncbi:uncharacterized protein LOC135054970 [Pseudophryne corroboree]|uniref:uncharacterized protein LOC135054970 n=1 Tax=Pseudophryne corroboree TaxID=495146 RepID=UPI0030821E56